MKIDAAHAVRFRAQTPDGKPLVGAAVGLVAPNQYLGQDPPLRSDGDRSRAGSSTGRARGQSKTLKPTIAVVDRQGCACTDDPHGRSAWAIRMGAPVAVALVLPANRTDDAAWLRGW